MTNPMDSKLLISEPPLQVLPSLAVAIGLKEALFLQQLHYRLLQSEHIIDGRPWVYNSMVAWREQFPFWSIDTMKRTITSTRKHSLILTRDYNNLKQDRTLWYTIDYDVLYSLEDMHQTLGQFAPVQKGNLPSSSLGQNAPMSSRDLKSFKKIPPLPPHEGGPDDLSGSRKGKRKRIDPHASHNVGKYHNGRYCHDCKADLGA